MQAPTPTPSPQVHTAAMVLDKCALIKYERKSGQLQPTDLGRVSAYYYVSHTLGLGLG